MLIVVLTVACGDAPGVPDDLEQACRQRVACESETGAVTRRQIDECREALSDEYDEAATYGCAAAHAALVACQAIVPLVCSMQGPGSCEAELGELERCRSEAGQ